MKIQEINQTVPNGENCDELSCEHEVIARLSTSKKESDAEFMVRGVRDGRRWAEAGAAAIELERLEQALDSGYYDFDDEDSGTLFCLLVKPELGGDQRFIADFWREVIGQREVPEGPYVQGFVNGAMETWDHAKVQG